MGFNKALTARVAKAEALTTAAENYTPPIIFMTSIDASLKADVENGPYREANIVGAFSEPGHPNDGPDVTRLPGEDLEAFNARCGREHPEVRVFMYRYGGVES